jgi:hypothetical protein
MAKKPDPIDKAIAGLEDAAKAAEGSTTDPHTTVKTLVAAVRKAAGELKAG